MIKIPLNSVKYFESNSRMVLIHMLQTDADGRVRAGTKKFSGKIKELKEALGTAFVIVDRKVCKSLRVHTDSGRNGYHS